MILDDPRVKQILAMVTDLSAGDTGIEMDLMLTAIVRWSTRYASCPALLAIAINVLTETRTAALEATADRQEAS